MTPWLQRLLVFVLGLMVGCGYCAWRTGLPLVWDDTSTAATAAALQEVTEGEGWFASFHGVHGGGYRPLSTLIRHWGTRLATDPHVLPPAVLALNAVVLGCLASSYFWLAIRATGSLGWGLYATFLLLCSMPMLTGALVIFAGIQAVVPLALCLALVCHEQGNSTTGWPRRMWFAGLCAVFIAGPWYREFIGMAPLLIAISEWRRARRLTWLHLLAALAFLHALFPTALMHLLIPSLPVAPVFRLGSLGAVVKPLPDHISPGTVIRAVQALHWRIFLDLFSIVPPTAVVLAVAGVLVSRRSRTVASESTSVTGRTPPSKTSLDAWLLVLFFLATFLPFLKVFKIQMHLAYCLVPFCLLLAMGTRKLCEAAGKSRWRGFAQAALIVVVLDQGLNPWIVRQATATLYTAIGRQATWLKDSVPRGTPVVCNALQIQDITWFSGGHIRGMALSGGTPDSRDWITSVGTFNALLARETPGSVLLLDVRLPSLTGQPGTKRTHYIVQEHLVEMQPLQVAAANSSDADEARFAWPQIDPLRWLIPPQNVSWPGPPDLEFDGYRGPDRRGWPWLREMALEYHLYRVTGRAASPWEPNPTLIEEYERFNIVLHGSTCYGIPEPEGAFDLARIQRGGYSRIVIGKTVEEVRKGIGETTQP